MRNRRRNRVDRVPKGQQFSNPVRRTERADVAMVSGSMTGLNRGLQIGVEQMDYYACKTRPSSGIGRHSIYNRINLRSQC